MFLIFYFFFQFITNYYLNNRSTWKNSGCYFNFRTTVRRYIQCCVTKLLDACVQIKTMRSLFIVRFSAFDLLSPRGLCFAYPVLTALGTLFVSLTTFILISFPPFRPDKRFGALADPRRAQSCTRALGELRGAQPPPSMPGRTGLYTPSRGPTRSRSTAAAGGHG